MVWRGRKREEGREVGEVVPVSERRRRRPMARYIDTDSVRETSRELEFLPCNPRPIYSINTPPPFLMRLPEKGSGSGAHSYHHVHIVSEMNGEKETDGGTYGSSRGDPQYVQRLPLRSITPKSASVLFQTHS